MAYPNAKYCGQCVLYVADEMMYIVPEGGHIELCVGGVYWSPLIEASLRLFRCQKCIATRALHLTEPPYNRVIPEDQLWEQYKIVKKNQYKRARKHHVNAHENIPKETQTQHTTDQQSQQ